MRRSIIGVFVIALLVSLPALADWDPTQPYKWVQMPDETDYGIDVNASYGYILADDFECTQTGPIEDIHIWASWRYDYLPYGHPDSVRFILSIHEDIPDPDGPGPLYSMPGQTLWYRLFRPGEFRSVVWNDLVQEGWMDPPEMYFFPGDQIIWQYNFFIPEGEEFWQAGTPDEPITYWLDVKAIPFDPEAFLGWKTSRDHWNDDAVWGDGSEPYLGPWFELRYPPGHEWYGQSIDLAFVITGEEPTELDWGDAPEPGGAPGYPTTSLLNGANHVIAGPWLGDPADPPDPEPDGQPSPAALGDDTDGNDDEDGVQIPPLMQGGTATINFEVRGGNAWVVGWIDYDGSMTWDASEQVYSNLVAPGFYAVNVTVPSSAVVGQTFSRWRICSAFAPGPDGAAPDGEVEDYEVWIEEGQAYKWEQWPDLTPTGIDVNATYPYILADDFQCTEPGRIIEIHVWGSWLDDWLPFGDMPDAVDFILSFHEDIPDSDGTGYSMPGDVLWFRNFLPGEFTYEIFASNIEEGWMDPPDDYWFPADWTCWLYRFYVPVSDAFFQAGSLDSPIVYWLDVQARPHDPYAWFGWKTSLDHWNDDAVWGDGMEPYFGPWFELIYPPNHPLYPQSIDLAFRLMNEPSSGVPIDRPIPEGFKLYQNVPNPFGATTTIHYSLPVAGHASLEIFDVTGRVVATLVDEARPAGMNTVTWSGRDDAGRPVPAGIYFYRVVSGTNEMTSKMLYLK